MECDICHSAQHFRRECPRGDGRGRVRQYIWVERIPTYSTSIGSRFWPTLLTAQPQSFISWLPGICASMNLENYADELFEE
eukprot:4883462-Pyramimonas_sp.AAC.1